MAETYQIGPFVLDADAQVLVREGQPVSLGQRAVAVLLVLVRSAGEYVPKPRIMDSAWPGMVVEENNLSVQISSVRRALALAPGGEAWLETLARRGYRFVGPVAPAVDSLARDCVSHNVASPLSNLPLQLSSLVGREQNLAELRLLAGAARLITLTGAGGLGKIATIPGRGYRFAASIDLTIKNVQPCRM